MEFLNVHQMSPGNYIFLGQRCPLDSPPRADILGVDILGVDVLGVDILGVDISAPTR